ncbi:hypothetical protein [Spirillospora sp. CA-294931]|uniref:hypothetical protein n=1 Tax=Spirillospora sp. CA-294931 TaxID=3240042 RepID=UPI003D8CA5A1
MSDQGERVVRWTETSEAAGEGARVSVPEVEVPAPEGRTEFSGPVPHDVWGKVEATSAEPQPEPQPESPAPVEDVKVAPVAPGFGVPPEPEAPVVEAAPAWEGSLFDGESSAADSVPAVETHTGPGKPGKPSSGNWRMPEWMADEEAADAKLGGRASSDDDGGRGRLVLYSGVGLLVVALVAAGAVYYLKSKDENTGKAAPANDGAGAAREKPVPPVPLPQDRRLRKFPGKASKPQGVLADRFSGLAVPRFGGAWQLATKKNKLAMQGWSGQQVMVTEKRPGRIWYGQLMTGKLSPVVQGSYKGPASLKTTAAAAVKELEGRYYNFPHKSSPLASQALTVGGRKGWLIAEYLTYKRPGVRATGELVVAAVVDTGKPVPAVAFAALPNTHRKLWPDVNRFVEGLRLAS